MGGRYGDLQGGLVGGGGFRLCLEAILKLSWRRPGCPGRGMPSTHGVHLAAAPAAAFLRCELEKTLEVDFSCTRCREGAYLTTINTSYINRY